MNQPNEVVSMLHKQLWRKPQPSESVARSTLYSRRIILLILTTLLIVALLMSLTEVLRQPQTHLFIFEDQIPDYSQLESVLAVEPLAYPASPEMLFRELRPVPVEPGEESAKTPLPRCEMQAVNRLTDLVPTIERKRQKQGIRSRDVVLIYLRAQGISDGDNAVLLVHTGNPKAPLKRFSVSDLLEELSFQTRATFVMIDYGTLETDIASGILVNQFNSSLQRALNKQGQENLWVITSHDLFEKSYVSDQDQRSIFESVLSHGLHGWADLNHDGWVELQEMLSFLKQKVQLRVDEESEQRQQQTVRILKSHAARGTENWNQRMISSALERETSDEENGTSSGQPPTQAGLLSPVVFAQYFTTALQQNSSSDSKPNQKPTTSPGETAVSVEKKPAQSNSKTEKTDSAQDAPPKSVDIGQTLKECWEIHDQLLESSPWIEQTLLNLPVASYAPAEWKNLETLLVHATALARRPGNANLNELNSLLSAQVLPLKKFDPTQPIPEAVGIARSIDRAFPRQTVSWPAPGSFVLLNWLIQSHQRLPDKDLLQIMQEFKKALAADNSDLMEKWIGEHPELTLSIEEARLCNQLLSSGTSWALCRSMILTSQDNLRCRLSRWIASDYSQKLVSQADELFLYAKSKLNEPPISVDETQIKQTLSLSRDLYSRVHIFHRELATIENMLWAQVMKETSAKFDQPTPESQRIFSEDTFDNVLDLRDIANAYEYLKNEKQVNSGMLHQQWNSLMRRPVDPNEIAEPGPATLLAKRANAILLGSAEKTKANTLTMDGEFNVPPVMLLSGSQLLDVSLRPVKSWKHVEGQIQLAYSQAQLAIALWGEETTEFKSLQQIYQKAGKHFRPLNEFEAAISNPLNFQNETIELSKEFGVALAAFIRDFYESKSIGKADQDSTASPHHRIMRALFCALPASSSLNSQTELKNTDYLKQDVGSIVLALRGRLLEQVEVSATRYPQLQQRADEIRPTVFGVPVWPQQKAKGLPVEIELDSPVDLQASSASKFELEITSNQDQPQNIWLTTEFDTQQFVLESLDGNESNPAEMMPFTGVDHFHAIRRIADYRPLSKYLEEVKGVQSAIQLQPRETRKLSFQISRIDPLAKTSRLFFNVLTEERIVRYPVWINCGQASPVQLTLNSPQAIVLSAEAGWTLRMRPNAVADIELTASNASDTSQKVALWIVGLDAIPDNLPPVTVDANLATQIQQQWNLPQTLSTAVDYEVPALATRFPLLTSPDSSGPPAPPVEQTSVPPVLIAILKNIDLNLVSYLPIQTEILHPQEYLQSNINYDSNSKSLTIELTRSNPGFPAASAIPVEAELSSANDASSLIHFPIRLPSEKDQIQFETSLSAVNASSLRIALSVDGYPRAFRYELPLNQSIRNLARSTESEINILSPLAETAYSNQAKEFTGKLKADLGFASGIGKETYIEFGIDINQDRVLFQEPSFKLNQDRLPLLFYSMTGNSLQLRNQVQDLSILVPLNNLTNQRVNLLGRVHTEQGDVWSQPVEIILDGNPPQITDVVPLSTAIIGMPLPVEITVSDGKLSGVEKVSVVLDVSQKGEITPDAALVDAQKNENGQWIAQVPTADAKPQSYLLLAQAIDRAGNVSQTARTVVKFFSAEQMKEQEEVPNKTVRGQIIYGKEPVEAAAITLKDATGVNVGEQKSDENGRFVIKDLKPGAYKLSVRAVERGKIRTLTQSIELTPTSPEANLMLKLE